MEILKQSRTVRRIAPCLLAIASLGIVLVLPKLSGATPLISQGFLTKGSIAPGSIVSLVKNSTENVESTSIDNVNNTLGVVIESGNSPVTLSTDQSNQVQVATNGLESVLVSDINGTINQGDSITASPIVGVGMKATSNTKIVGVSQGSFPNATASQQTVKDKSGKELKVKLGEVNVLINVTNYFKEPNKTIIPPALQNLANAVANKTVSPLPIIISAAIFVITLIIVMSIIYALIRNSIISVGRNPMAQSAVYRNVIMLAGLVLGILVVAVGSIYMVLTKF